MVKKTKKKSVKTIRKTELKKTTDHIEPKQIHFCPTCNSTFVQKIIHEEGYNPNGHQLPYFICHHCGNISDNFPQIEANRIHDLPHVKQLNEIKQSNAMVQSDPFKFILSMAIGFILIIFGAYLVYLSLDIASFIYMILLVIGGIFLIMGALKHKNIIVLKNQNGIKK